MNHQAVGQPRKRYEFGAWRSDDTAFVADACLYPPRHRFEAIHRDARDQSRLLDLLGRINYKILKGASVYIQVGGSVYKTVCGLYWRSVFTGVEHYLLRCREVSWSVWEDDDVDQCDPSSAHSATTTAHSANPANLAHVVDLPITHSKSGWTANGQSLMFMLHRE